MKYLLLFSPDLKQSLTIRDAHVGTNQVLTASNMPAKQVDSAKR